MTLAQALAVAAAGLVTAAGADTTACLLSSAQARVATAMRHASVCHGASSVTQHLRTTPDWVAAYGAAAPDASIHASARM